MTKPTRFLSIAAVALLSACGSDSGTGPTANSPVDLATAFTEMSLPALSTVVSLAGGVAAPSTATVPSGCAYVAASQNFVCPAVATGGMTVTSNYVLLDAAGQPMAQFDAKTVASLRVRSTIVGTVTEGTDSFTIDGQQDQTLSGLQTSTHTLNGTSTINLSGTGGSASIRGPFTARNTTTISNVVLPAYGSGSNYPKSGTITMDQTMTLTGSAAFTTKLVMTFNGTSKVGVTLTLDGLSGPGCSIDLANNATSCG